MSGLIYFNGFAGFPVSEDSETIYAGEPVRLLLDGSVVKYESDSTSTSDYAIGLAVDNSTNKSAITVALPSSLVLSATLSSDVLAGQIVEYDEVAREWVPVGESSSQVQCNILCLALDNGGAEGRIVMLSCLQY